MSVKGDAWAKKRNVGEKYRMTFVENTTVGRGGGGGGQTHGQ